MDDSVYAESFFVKPITINYLGEWMSIPSQLLVFILDAGSSAAAEEKVGTQRKGDITQRKGDITSRKGDTSA